jgi:hypothetical protein
MLEMLDAYASKAWVKMVEPMRTYLEWAGTIHSAVARARLATKPGIHLIEAFSASRSKYNANSVLD